MRSIGGHWSRFEADQRILIHKCAFDWRARTGPFGMLRIRDALLDGQGQLDVQAFGAIPLAHFDAQPPLTRGEIMRYLAEIPWAPHAILSNPALLWRGGDGGMLWVGAKGTGDVAWVRLELDEEGRIGGVFAPDRPRMVDDGFVPTPWTGRFSDYRCQDGLRLPFAASVSWLVGGVEEIVWEGRLTGWQMISAGIGETNLPARIPLDQRSGRRPR